VTPKRESEKVDGSWIGFALIAGLATVAMIVAIIKA